MPVESVDRRTIRAEKPELDVSDGRRRRYLTIKRIFDILMSLFVLLFSAPVLLVASVGIKLSSRGPILYLPLRVGLHARFFRMYKLRTMQVRASSGSLITAPGDSRILFFGRLLRATKVDELPQFLNVLVGQMSIVGPRPEDPHLVKNHYTEWMRRTLDVKPGITSPGSIFYYLCSDDYIDPTDPEASYVREILPLKLAGDLRYFERPSLLGDLKLVWRTVQVIALHVTGWRRAADPPEKADAEQQMLTIIADTK